jgi:hypothetical protein
MVMNERIQELADKIWAEEYWDNPNTDKLLPAQLNKFAQLIVKECLDQCYYRGMNDELYEGQLKAAAYIEQHFGVEE